MRLKSSRWTVSRRGGKVRAVLFLFTFENESSEVSGLFIFQNLDRFVPFARPLAIRTRGHRIRDPRGIESSTLHVLLDSTLHTAGSRLTERFGKKLEHLFQNIAFDGNNVFPHGLIWRDTRIGCESRHVLVLAFFDYRLCK